MFDVKKETFTTPEGPIEKYGWRADKFTIKSDSLFLKALLSFPIRSVIGEK